MDFDRAARLWNRFLGDETLSPREERELLDALESDAPLRRRVLDDGRMNGLLSGFGRVSREGDAFAREFADYLRAEEDGDRFVHIVRLQLLRGASASLRPGASRRSLGRGMKGLPSSLLPIGLSAGFLIATMLVFSQSAPVPSQADPKTGHASRLERESTEEARRAALPREKTLIGEVLVQKAEEDRAQATKARDGSEGRLANIREEEGRAKEARQAADAGKEKDRKVQAEAAFREILRKREEEKDRLSKLRDDEDRAAQRQHVLARSTQESAPKESSGATKVAVALLERIDGEVVITQGSEKRWAKGGEGLLSGQGLEMRGAKSRGVLMYPDKTRVEFGPDTEVRDIEIEGGKRLFILKGSISASVTKQPAGEPMIFATPHGEARVVGTTLRLHVDPDPKKGTRLDVEEGKVELKNLSRKTVCVESGRYVVAASGVEFIARRRASTVTAPESLGEAAVLGTDDMGNANILLAQLVTLDHAASLEGLSLYVSQARGKLRLGVYDATGPGGGPGRKLAETAELTPGAGWNTVAVAPMALLAGNYWLAYLPSDNNLHIRVERGMGTETHYPHAYGAMPSTFSTAPTRGSAHWSFCAILNPP